MRAKPVIAVTMGDAAGVGPELCLRALAGAELTAEADLLVFGDAGVLARVASACRLPNPGRVVSASEFSRFAKWSGGSAVIDFGMLAGDNVKPGAVDAACGRAAYAYVEAAVKAAMDGRIGGLTTAPLNKESLHLGGVEYPGHTEILAALTGARRTCMTLTSDKITVSLVTVHTAYANVPGLLDTERIVEVIDLTNEFLKTLGNPAPRIVVCGLNPHAGENGLFGDEERRIIKPAVGKARAAGTLVEGPLPPDTAFVPALREKTDAYVAMYHDQGLIPFKMLAFDRGVNVTLGLPIVRTSVDHGTAFDVAWKGLASSESLFAAIRLALRLIGRY